MRKILSVLAIILAMVLLASCVPTNGEFKNHGDNLGGGGIGDVASETENDNSSTVGDITDKSDLGDLSGNTSGEGATEEKPSAGIVEISESGTYYFKGEYGGIAVMKKGIDVHLIFDGATILSPNGIAINGSDNKPASVILTLNEGTENYVENGGDDVNAIHIKGLFSINGKGTLNVKSLSKSAIKSSKDIQIVDAVINISSANHGISGQSITAENCVINVTSAAKDGINAECDGDTHAFTTEEGYVSLKNVSYTCDVLGDGIQADTVVYIDGGNYDIKTTGNFVQKSSAAMTQYGLTADDFKYIKSGTGYQRIASDEAGRYGTNIYALSQGCKGIKVGEVEYDDENGNAVTVTDGSYLIAIKGGTFDIDSTDDAIHSNSGNLLVEGGTFNISTYDDALTSDELTRVTGGTITVEKSYEGIEGTDVEISGGKIDITASDDGINAASDAVGVTEHIIISGGDVTVNSGGDGIDSNGSILISGGYIVVHGPSSGADAGLDADNGIVIQGGTLFAASTLGMVETPSTNSTQYVVSYAHGSTIGAGSTVSLCDSNGDPLVSVQVLKSCQSIIISSPDIAKGGSYSIYGGSTQMTSFTVTSIITSIGSTGGSFPGGGFGGGPGGPGGWRPGGRG